MKNLFALLIFFIVVGVGLWLYNNRYTLTPIPTPPSSASSCAVTIVSPHAGSAITNPLSINLIIDNSKPGCHWTVFEGQAGTATLTDSSGKFLGQAVLKTTEDWTLTKPTAYNAVITLTKHPSSGVVNLILQEENPSGKPNPQEITISLSAK
jgi:hypothetical protein